jgi:mRNA interferase RelE/StbE
MKLKKALRLTRTERFKKSVLELDQRTRDKLKKQLRYLLSDPRHPSLHVKKIKGTQSIFEARVNDSYRFTFDFGEDQEVILRVVRKHNSALKKP